MSDFLAQLDQILAERRNADPDSSYVANLHHKGLNKILEKVGEECTEAVIAAKDQNLEELVKETADLWFHSMVMLSHLGSDSQAVIAELERRFGTSGIEEKASRNQQGE